MESKYKLKKYNPERKRFKKFIIKTVFYILGKSIQILSDKDNDIELEISCWTNKRNIMLTVLDNGPCMALTNEKVKLKYCGNCIDNPNLIIYFRNIDSAFKILTGQIGMMQAYAEHSLFVKGSISESMQFVKITNIVETILFPRFIQKKIFSSLPKMNTKKILLRIYLYIRSILWFFKSLFKK